MWSNFVFEKINKSRLKTTARAFSTPQLCGTRRNMYSVMIESMSRRSDYITRGEGFYFYFVAFILEQTELNT